MTLSLRFESIFRFWRLLAVLGLGLLCFVWGAVSWNAWDQVGHSYAGFRVNRVAVVWITNEPYLPGIQAGLRAGDRIVALNRTRVTNGDKFQRHVRGLPPATPVTYTYQRGENLSRLTIPTRRFGVVDFLLAFGVRLGLPLLMALLGFSALWLRPENKAAQANLVFCLGWAFYGLLDIDFEWTSLFHPLWYYASVMVYASGALAMALNFPVVLAPLVRHPFLQLVPYLGSAALFAPIFWLLISQGVVVPAVDGSEQIAAAWANGVLLLGLAIFIARFRRARDTRQRSQLQVLLLGVALAYLPYALLANVPLLLSGRSAPPGVLAATSLLFVVFPLSTSYAIVRHGMFDIEVIVKRTTTYALLTSALLGGYFALAATVRWLTSQFGLQGSEWENAIVTALIAVAFVPLRDSLTRAVDRLFSRVPYDFRAVVARITSAAQASIDVNVLKGDFLTAIDEALGPRFVYILTRDREGNSLSAVGSHAVWGDAPVPELHIRSDDELLHRAGSSSESEYEPGSGETSPLSMLAAVGRHYRVPLRLGEEVVGLLILGPRRSDKEYAPEDRELLAATRLPLAAAIKTASLVEDRLFKDRVEQDLRRAREVQEAMLPRDLPVVTGYQFAATSIPCYEASGDYYDCVLLPEGDVALAVADVAGKGFAAALATAMLKSCLYNQIQGDPAVCSTLGALNRLLAAVTRRAQVKSYTTCTYALLAPEEGELEYACAGHFPPLHWKSGSGTVLEYDGVGGFPLGVRSETRYQESRIKLEPGDVLLFYTDGVTEAQSNTARQAAAPDFYESERLAEALRRSAHLPAQDILISLQHDLAQFVGDGEPTDDVTLLVVKRELTG